MVLAYLASVNSFGSSSPPCNFLDIFLKKEVDLFML